MRTRKFTEAASVGTESRSESPPMLFSTPHVVEAAVQRELLSQPGLRFSSLVVRRINGGVCLEGVLETADAPPDVDGLARNVAGVERVLNHLVVHRPVPAKG